MRAHPFGLRGGKSGYEARLRGDTLLLVGPGLMEAWPALEARLLHAPLAAEVEFETVEPE